MKELKLCTGENCTIKYKCLLYTSPENKLMQTYFDKPPFVITSDHIKCDYFWSSENTNFNKYL